MFSLIKNLFSKPKSKENMIEEIGIEIDQKELDYLKKIQEQVLDKELDKRDEFNLEFKAKIKAHVFGKINVIKSDVYLTAEEKEKLKISKRLKISKDLIELFHEDKIVNKNPKELLNNLRLQVMHKANLIKSVKDYKILDIKYVFLSPAEDERDCDWCTNNKKKKVSIDDALDLINDNCKCSYTRSYLKAKVDF